MIGNRIFQPETAKPAISKIEMHLFAQTTLGPNGETIANDQNPDHKLGINRGAARHAVMRRQLLAHPDYYAYREELLSFLEEYEAGGKAMHEKAA